MSWMDYIPVVSESHKNSLELIEKHAKSLGLDEDWFHRENPRYLGGKIPAEMMLSEEGAKELQLIMQAHLDNNF